MEQRVTIRATLDKVWQLVTRPGWWLPGSKAEPSRGPGRAAWRTVTTSAPTSSTWSASSQGLCLVPLGERLGGTKPAPSKATLVEFYLQLAGEELGVTVVESGFASLSLPEAVREDQWKGNRGGWQYELAGLRTRAEAVALYRGPDGHRRVASGLRGHLAVVFRGRLSAYPVFPLRSALTRGKIPLL